AIAVGQLAYLVQIHRHRWQASSHNGSAPVLRFTFIYGLALAHAFITVVRFGSPTHDCPSNWFPDLAQH
ncbi:hypothetical protein, partial [Pseudomonas fluorescens]|uniref:hypothetical protein n=1 Tax=Pseudomonas fluorescens TaxID=294 RepID=UPI001F3BBD98